MFGKLEDHNITLNRQGVGLGLTIADNLARLLCYDKQRQGIKVTSKYNVGSRFYFTIRKVYSKVANKKPRPEEELETDPSLTYLDDLDEIETKMIKCKTVNKKAPAIPGRKLDLLQVPDFRSNKAILEDSALSNSKTSKSPTDIRLNFNCHEQLKEKVKRELSVIHSDR